MERGIFQKGIAVGLGLSKSGEEKVVECLSSKPPHEFKSCDSYLILTISGRYVYLKNSCFMLVHEPVEEFGNASGHSTKQRCISGGR
jgi:hypothetical protein